MGVKKLAKSYDAFMASDTVIKQVPRLLGPGLSKASKFPVLVTHGDDLNAKMNDLKATIKFQMKKVLLPVCRCWQRRHVRRGIGPERAFGHELPGISAEEALAEREVSPHQVHHGPRAETVLNLLLKKNN